MQDPWDNIKHDNLYIIQIPEREEGEKGIQNVFEKIIADNLSNLKKETDNQVQKVHRVQRDEARKTYTKTYHN